MKSRTFLGILGVGILFLTPIPSLSQQWSPEEKEVLDQLAECWDIWMEGIQSGSPDRWYAECTAPGLTYWAAQDGAPLDTDFDRRNWDLAMANDLGWVDIRPVSLVLMEDIAVLHFYGYWKTPTADGEQVMEAKRTEVFRRIDGRWRLLVGHATPVTVGDGSPYRRIRK